MSDDVKTYKATLVRGNTYYLGNQRFDKGKPVNVTTAQKEHLDEHAVDVLTLKSNEGAEAVYKEKFEFEPLAAAVEGEEGAVAPKATNRTRGRG